MMAAEGRASSLRGRRRPPAKSLPLEVLRRHVRADTEGNLYRLDQAGSVKAGARIGTLAKSGYLVVTINRCRLQAHRVVFALAHGRWPTEIVDHINGVKTDNRPTNLREADNHQNNYNRRISPVNTSGVKGVSWATRPGKWQAAIRVNGRTVHLGRFDDLEEAAQAVYAARRKYHGEFARIA